MFTITLKATTTIRFKKTNTLQEAKIYVVSEFKEKPGWRVAWIYDPETQKEITRRRGEDWKTLSRDE